MKLHKVLEWSDKYSSIKSFDKLSNGTMVWYNWCSKVGRKKYLKCSRIKTKRFVNKNPNDLNFRVFKTKILKGKNVNIKLMGKFKKLIETKGTVKRGFKYRHLSPKALYLKMKEF